MRISKKMTIAILVLVPWALRYLGLDAWLPTPDDIEAVKQLGAEMRQAKTSELPALVGVAYVAIQGWIDARRAT